jgi:hypothetical protein
LFGQEAFPCRVFMDCECIGKFGRTHDAVGRMLFAKEMPLLSICVPEEFGVSLFRKKQPGGMMSLKVKFLKFFDGTGKVAQTGHYPTTAVASLLLTLRFYAISTHSEFMERAPGIQNKEMILAFLQDLVRRERGLC